MKQVTNPSNGAPVVGFTVDFGSVVNLPVGGSVVLSDRQADLLCHAFQFLSQSPSTSMATVSTALAPVAGETPVPKKRGRKPKKKEPDVDAPSPDELKELGAEDDSGKDADLF